MGQAGVPGAPWPPSLSSSLFLTELHETCSSGAAFRSLLRGTPQGIRPRDLCRAEPRAGGFPVLNVGSSLWAMADLANTQL